MDTKEIHILSMYLNLDKTKKIHTSWQNYLLTNFQNLLKELHEEKVGYAHMLESSEWWNLYKDNVYDLPIMWEIPLWYIFKKFSALDVFACLKYVSKNLLPLIEIERYNKKTLDFLKQMKIERLEENDLHSIILSSSDPIYLAFMITLVMKLTAKPDIYQTHTFNGLKEMGLINIDKKYLLH